MDQHDVLATASAEEAGRLRLIIEATPNAMLMVGAGGRIVLVNAQAETLFGYPRADLLQMTVEDLIPARYRPGHHGYRDSYLTDPDARPMGAGRDLFGVRGDGTEVPIEIGLNPIRLGGDHFVLASVIDISERLAAQAAVELAGKDALRRSILASMPCSVIVTDLAGSIVAVNPATEKLLGYAEEELVGLPLDRLHFGRHTDETDWSEAAAGEETERVYRRKDGSRVPVGEMITSLLDEETGMTGHLAVAFDISKRMEARAKVEYLANHDVLTGLPNRSLLGRHLDEALAQAAVEGGEVALMLLDVDHFKRINDTLGHHAGDELLLRLAERLKGGVRAGDMVARLGGDEFVIVFTDVAHVSDLNERIQALTETLPTSMALNGQEFHVTSSVGGAVYPQHGASATDLLKHADIAMYRAKAAGRNNVQWFEPGMLDETNEKVVMSLALRQALERDDQLSVVYQPQVDLGTGEVVGVEALARWDSPLLGRVPPDRFISVAEDGALIEELGGWVLRRACADIAALRVGAGGVPLRLAVNVSPRQFASRTWLDDVRAALADAGLEPSSLELEITEGTLMSDHHDVLPVLHGLKELGVRIVVDDFGQGYSSLAYLTRFPVDKLKIDRTFVWRLSAAGADAAIVDAILAMAQALGMAVVAEGVETADQEDYLRRRGCDEGQGYLYSEGVPSSQLDETVRRIASRSTLNP